MIEMQLHSQNRKWILGMSIKAGTLEHQLGKRERIEFLEKLK